MAITQFGPSLFGTPALRRKRAADFEAAQQAARAEQNVTNYGAFAARNPGAMQTGGGTGGGFGATGALSMTDLNRNNDWGRTAMAQQAELEGRQAPTIRNGADLPGGMGRDIPNTASRAPQARPALDGIRKASATRTGGGEVLEDVMRGITSGRSGPGALLALREAGLMPSLETAQAEDRAAYRKADNAGMTDFEGAQVEGSQYNIDLQEGERGRKRMGLFEDARAGGRAKSMNYWQYEEPVEALKHRNTMEQTQVKADADMQDDLIRERAARYAAELRLQGIETTTGAGRGNAALRGLQAEIANARTNNDMNRVEQLTAQFDAAVAGADGGGGDASQGGGKVISQADFNAKLREMGWTREEGLAQLQQWGYTLGR